MDEPAHVPVACWGGPVLRGRAASLGTGGGPLTPQHPGRRGRRIRVGPWGLPRCPLPVHHPPSHWPQVPWPSRQGWPSAHRGVLQGEARGRSSVGRSVRDPRLGAVGAVGALDPRPEEGAAQWRAGLWAKRLHLQLQLSLQLSLLFGLLVAFLQVLHQHSDHHVDQHKLGRQHEGHKVDGGDDRIVAGGLLVTVPEGVLRAAKALHTVPGSGSSGVFLHRGIPCFYSWPLILLRNLGSRSGTASPGPGPALAGPPWLWVLTFMMPFQLSPVETRKRVRKAMPKFRKVACRPRPSQGCVSSHSRGGGQEREARVSAGAPGPPALAPLPSPPQLTQVSKELHTQSCKDEKQQHEEKSQVPHLEERKRNGKGATGSPSQLP